MENKWRAARYGLDGMLIDFGIEEEKPERELILEYLDFVDDVLDESGVPEGSRVRADASSTAAPAPTASCKVFAETGDLRKVVEYMVQETEAGL